MSPEDYTALGRDPRMDLRPTTDDEDDDVPLIEADFIEVADLADDLMKRLAGHQTIICFGALGFALVDTMMQALRSDSTLVDLTDLGGRTSRFRSALRPRALDGMAGPGRA